MSETKLKNVVLVNDNVIVRPLKGKQSAKGIIMPTSTNGEHKIVKGYVLKVGPGYPVNVNEGVEWKGKEHQNSYIKLQAEEGDLAHFFAAEAVEVILDGEAYLVMPHDSIVLLEKLDV